MRPKITLKSVNNQIKILRREIREIRDIMFRWELRRRMDRRYYRLFSKEK